MAALALATAPPPVSGCCIHLDDAAGRGDFFGTCATHGRVRVTEAAVRAAIRAAAETEQPVETLLVCPGPWRPLGVVRGPWGKA